MEKDKLDGMHKRNSHLRTRVINLRIVYQLIVVYNLSFEFLVYLFLLSCNIKKWGSKENTFDFWRNWNNSIYRKVVLVSTSEYFRSRVLHQGPYYDRKLRDFWFHKYEERAKKNLVS